MPSNNNHNKYELRSTDVQEVMNKPPSKLITWGNTVIILTLIIGFWLLTLFRLPVTFKTAFEIRQISQSDKTKLLFELTTPKNVQDNFNIPLPTTAKLSLDNYSFDKYGSVPVVIDSVGVSKNPNILKLYIISSNKSQNNHPLIKLRRGMSGKISIKIGTESVFKKLLGHIF